MFHGSICLTRRFMPAALLLGLGVTAAPSSADTITDSYFVGIGDSYTAPYAPRSSRNHHRSWLEQLDSHNPGGSFTNLAISGTTTATAQANGDSHYQLQAGLNAISGNGAGVVFIGLGVNDFTDLLESGAVKTQAEAFAVADAAYANLTQLVDALLDPVTGNPQAQIVIANSVDRGSWAGRSGPAYDLNREVTTLATQRYNQLIADEFAGNRGMAVADTYRLLEDLLAGDPADSNTGAGPNGELFIAGQAININPLDSMGSDQPSDHLWADGAHPGAVFQGLFGNVVLTALEQTYGIEPGSEGLISISEIFATTNALHTNDGVDLTVSDTGYTFDYGAYVVPEPGSVALLLVGAGLLVCRRRPA